ncbi:hypothetical protein Tco_0046267 [Tanacetum coccineum]
MFTNLCPHMYKMGILKVNCSNITPHSRQSFDYCLVFPTSLGGFLHLVSLMQLDVVVLVAALGSEFVFRFAPLKSSLSQLVLVFDPLRVHLVSALVHLEFALEHLESALFEHSVFPRLSAALEDPEEELAREEEFEEDERELRQGSEGDGEAEFVRLFRMILPLVSAVGFCGLMSSGPMLQGGLAGGIMLVGGNAGGSVGGMMVGGLAGGDIGDDGGDVGTLGVVGDGASVDGVGAMVGGETPGDGASVDGVGAMVGGETPGDGASVDGVGAMVGGDVGTLGMVGGREGGVVVLQLDGVGGEMVGGETPGDGAGVYGVGTIGSGFAGGGVKLGVVGGVVEVGGGVGLADGVTIGVFAVGG